jgi:hypothetical protein
MSNFDIIQRISNGLRHNLYEALRATPDVDFRLSNEERDISLLAPAAPKSGPPFLSLYLYHIQPETYLRNQPVNSDGPTLRHPPLAIELSYLVTPQEDQADQNQLILGRVMQYLYDYPFLNLLKGTRLDNSFGAGSPEVRLMLEPFTVEEITRVWTALQAPFQLSIAYKVRVVLIDSARGETPARRVHETETLVEHKERGSQ